MRQELGREKYRCSNKYQFPQKSQLCIYNTASSWKDLFWVLSANSFELLMTVGLGISQGHGNNSMLFSVYDRDRIEAGRDAE